LTIWCAGSCKSLLYISWAWNVLILSLVFFEGWKLSLVPVAGLPLAHAELAAEEVGISSRAREVEFELECNQLRE